MTMPKRFSFLLLTLFLLRGGNATAQELNFTVKVVNPQVRTADPKLFQSLEQALREFINNTKWTDDVFEQNERITGSITLTIDKENSTNSFAGKLAITANRPIYGTAQETALFTHLDDQFGFAFEQFQPLIFAKNTYTDNLTATLAYYINVILGMDYDSFSPQGGELYWQTAQEIFNLVPDGQKNEWRGRELGNQRRYFFIENVLSPRLKNYRQAVYTYHRQGLDYAAQDVNRCKNAIMQALEYMDEAQQGYPNTLAIRTFANTKFGELIEIFKGASPEQKSRFVEIMTRLDPANASRYQIVR
jgi:Domain of unknown function (DUF4835)